MTRVQRSRASLACQSCRRRKVKCDAQTTPVGIKCTPCQQMDLPCAVDRNGDRRKSGSRKHVETLEQRIKSLETLLRQTQQSGRQSDISWDMDSRSDGEEPAQDLLSAPGESPPLAPMQLDAAPRAPEEAQPAYLLSPMEPAPLTYDLDLSNSLLEMDDSLCPPRHDVPDNDGNELHRSSRALAPPPANPGTSLRSESSLSSPNKSTEMSPGALGPTSQFHVRLSGSHSQDPSTASDELADLGIAVDTNSVQVKNKLLHSFFRYQTLWVSVVDEGLFQRHRRGGEPSMWYSPFLETVMLACAARLSTSGAVRSLGEQYSAQAKAGILEALENPSAASMQGFLLLSEYEVTHGRDRMGWQLCGMACRLLSDLGLHESLDSMPESQSVPMLHLLGACTAVEGVWCMYLGRPSSIPRFAIQRAAASCEKLKTPESATLSAWISLCKPMADICEVLNSDLSVDAEAKGRLLQLNGDLQHWLASLPSGFGYEEPNTADLDPTAYGVHLQYNKVQILIQQALCGCDASRPMARPTEQATEDHSHQVIYDASIRIIRLLLTYRQIHGLEKIPSVMLDNVNLALMTLIHHYLQQPDLIQSQTRHVRWLRLAMETMISIQPHFPVIARMLDSVRVTVDGTPLASLLKAPEASPGARWPPSPVERAEQEGGSGTESRGWPGHLDSLGRLIPRPLGDDSNKLASGAFNTLDVARMLRNEPTLPHQSPDGDPERLSGLLLCWPNPAVDSLWGQG